MHRTDRLRRRQPDVGAQGASPRSAHVRHAERAGGSRRRRRHHRAGRRPLRRDRALDGGVARRRSTRRIADGCRCSASASACSGCSRAATRRRTFPGSACCRARVRGWTISGGSARRSRTSAGTRSTSRQTSRLLDGVAAGAQVYFTHSYAAPVTDATASPRRSHGEPFAAAVERGHIVGVQFHPEKSGDAGLRMSGNFRRRSAWRLTGAADAVQAHHRVPRRPRRPGRQGRQLRGPASRRRSGGARAALQRRRASTSWSSSTSPRRSRSGGRWPTRFVPCARAVHPAGRRRRHPHRGGRGGGGRCRRRQGQPEHRGARGSRR